MKKLLLAVLIIAFLAVPAFAKEYRVQADVLFLNEADAIALFNVLETYKAKVFQQENYENGSYEIPTAVCFIDSWDTETPPKAGFKRMCIDWEAEAQVWKVADDNSEELQVVVDERQAKIDAKQAELDDEQTALDIKKAELQVLKADEVAIKEVIAK